MDVLNIGPRVAQLRRSRRWTQAYLAELVGTSERYIGHLETGVRSPGVPTLVKLAHAFGVSIADLLTDPQPAESPAA